MKKTLVLSISLLISSATLMCMEKKAEGLVNKGYKEAERLATWFSHLDLINAEAEHYGPPCLDYSQSEFDCRSSEKGVYKTCFYYLLSLKNMIVNDYYPSNPTTAMSKRVLARNIWDWNTYEACREDKNEEACLRILEYRTKYPNYKKSPTQHEMENYIDNANSLLTLVQEYNKLYGKKEKK